LLLGGIALRVAPEAWANGAQTPVVDPYLGQPAAIDAGEQIYREKCIICHGKAGGRGPDLFAVTLSDEEFMKTVENGRPDTLMPAFGSRLSRDDIWKLRAFLKANPNGI
jgi:mono/diheme cytochrome c family protein